MTAPQLALGIFFGFGGLEVFKVAVAMFYERQKRNALRRDLADVADDFIGKMHRDIMADRAAQAAKQAKRRRPSAIVPPVKKPVAKKAPIKKTVTTKKGK